MIDVKVVVQFIMRIDHALPERQGACRRRPGEVFSVPDHAEPRFRPQQPARHPERYHVLLLVPAHHIARGFPPVAQHILNQIGAQKTHIERYRRSNAYRRAPARATFLLMMAARLSLRFSIVPRIGEVCWQGRVPRI